MVAQELGAALVEYKRATELDPKNGAALRGAAFVHIKRTEYSAAASLMRTASTIPPRFLTS